MNHLIGPFSLLMFTTLFAGCASTQLRQDAATVAAVGTPDELEYKIEHGKALTLKEIKSLSAEGVTDDILLRNIDASYAAYRLDSNQVEDLKTAGVSERVIDALLASGDRRRHYRSGYYSYGHRYGHGYGYRHRYHHYGHRRHRYYHHY